MDAEDGVAVTAGYNLTLRAKATCTMSLRVIACLWCRFLYGLIVSRKVPITGVLCSNKRCYFTLGNRLL